MKKMASIFAIGMVSMALATGPAFAQQVAPKPAENTPATVSPKIDETAAPSAAVTGEKTTTPKTAVSEPAAVKADVKKDAAKAETAVKSEKATSAKQVKQAAVAKTNKHHKHVKKTDKCSGKYEHHAKAKAKAKAHTGDADKKMEKTESLTPSAK
jgi:hypothetical protein